MSLQPLIEASLAIQIHTVSAILAFMLGGAILFRRKGDHMHRLGGRIWVGLMVVVCVSSFFIHEIRLVGIWSPIHLLSVGTLVALSRGVYLARSRRIDGHLRTMQATYFGALIVAGYFTFLPGRIMHRVVFDGFGTPYLPLIAGILAAAAAYYFWRRMAVSS
jgi:uncharacterized membrane protein